MPKYFEFEVSLCNVKPRIWRRFLIRQSATFMGLHEAIQVACGWEGSHLFRFRSGDETLAGIPDDEFGEPDPDAKRVKLAGFFGGHRKNCRYEYDFGDNWIHDVDLVATADLPQIFKRRLVDGARAFPPEDCGGIPGYEDCVRVFKGGKDPEDRREWMGDWQPERFDLKANQKSFNC